MDKNEQAMQDIAKQQAARYLLHKQDEVILRAFLIGVVEGVLLSVLLIAALQATRVLL